MNPNQQSVANKTLDVALGALMMVRRFSINYRENNSTVLSGFLPEAGFMGQQTYNGAMLQDTLFAFGFQDKDFY